MLAQQSVVLKLAMQVPTEYSDTMFKILDCPTDVVGRMKLTGLCLKQTVPDLLTQV